MSSFLPVDIPTRERGSGACSQSLFAALSCVTLAAFSARDEHEASA